VPETRNRLAAKGRGVYTGRKATIDADEIRRLSDAGVGGTEIAKRLKVSRSTVYRLIDEAKAA
jgi:DNA invertase Pin-like site-specific DNA recombinase